MTTRFALATGLALTLGLALMPLGCESWDRPTFTHIHSLPKSPDPWDPPAQVVDQLEACAQSLPAVSPPAKLPSYLVAFGMRVEESGEVGAATLKRSTLTDRGVEACMGGALRGMPLPMRELMEQAAKGGSKHAPSSELGGLFDDDSQVSLQMFPVALTVAGGVIIVVVVLWASHEVIKAILAPARATAAAPPRAAAGPKARRHPNQTCENEELDQLEEEKVTLCNKKAAADCTGKRDKSKVVERHDSIPCSAILKSLDERNACLTQRNLIEDKCYGGKPDPGHAEQIEKVKRGIELCEQLRDINCAEGHPMSGL